MLKRTNPIYFADLTHTTITISNDSFPLNIGYVASFFTNKYPNEDIALYKYPENLVNDIKKTPPKIIALSNYPWNLNLNLQILKLCKTIDPKIITVMGGPNLSYNQSEQEAFLRQHKEYLDCYVMFEGEKSFVNLFETLVENDYSIEKTKQSTIHGVISIYNDKMSIFQDTKRMKDVDENPSPYLSGILDKFFDEPLTPMLETHRGCPYKCTFCHEGSDYYKKLYRHSYKKVKDELYYIAKRVSSSVNNLIIADPNFGIYDEHIEIAKIIREIHDQFGWPKIVYATTAKNAQKRLIKIINILGKEISFPISMSVQSLDQNVLKNIKRSNIAIEDMYNIQKELITHNKDQFSRTEVILALPGETINSHMDSLYKLMELKIDTIYTYQLMMVNGSEMSLNEESRVKYDIKTKFRVIPRNISKNQDIGVAVEVEEIAVGTKDLTFKDYLEARKMHLLVSLFYNNRIFEGYFRFLDEKDIHLQDFFQALKVEIDKSSVLQHLIDVFIQETENELFDSEEEIISFVENDKNYEDILNGNFGANLIQKYTTLGHFNHLDDLTTIMHQSLLNFEVTKNSKELTCLTQYYEYLYKNYLHKDRMTLKNDVSFNYDILAWLKSDQLLQNFKLQDNLIYTFYTSKEQFQLIEDYFDRLGRSIQSIGKIMTRIGIYDLKRSIQINTNTLEN